MRTRMYGGVAGEAGRPVPLCRFSGQPVDRAGGRASSCSAAVELTDAGRLFVERGSLCALVHESALSRDTRNCTGFRTDCLHLGLTGVYWPFRGTLPEVIEAKGRRFIIRSL
jgi:hypothetical protein